MTKIEFNEYLQSIGGLKRAWGKEDLITDAGFFEIKEGWFDIVKKIIDELLTLNWDRKLYEVKQKVGGLRFYAVDVPDGGDTIIAKYEALSYKVCEICGKAGNLRDGSWSNTLCDEHSDGRIAIR